MSRHPIFELLSFTMPPSMKLHPDFWRAPHGSSPRTVTQDKRRAAKTRARRRARKLGHG
jgi:hypothetical protein